MKIKRFVARHITFRLIGVLCFSLGATPVWFWQTQPESTPTRFLVRLQPEAEKVQQNRNLSDYVFGGSTSDCNKLSEKEAYKCYSGARGFILEHWKDKRRAYIIFYFEGMHGDVEKHVFIEPDKNNEWRIVFTEDTYAETRGFNPNISVEMARTIKTERADRDGFYYKKGSFYLVFLDREGKIIEDF